MLLTIGEEAEIRHLLTTTVSKEAMLYDPIDGSKVKCNLCARRCSIPEGGTGFCRVRKNVGGKLLSLVYGKVICANPDPIEKKPLSNFNPGSLVFSIATSGCNFRCSFCQNWNISQIDQIDGEDLPPEDVIKLAKRSECQGVSYTYTEPTIFFEYAYDCSKLAHENGLFNTFVTNGYMTTEAVKTISPYLDAATVDFKAAGDPAFYRKFSSVPDVQPIYDSLKAMKANKMHIEITNLVIPRIGDSLERIRELSKWVFENLDGDVPFHLLRFHPDYSLKDLPVTPQLTLEKAREIAKSEGLRYVYTGNMPGHVGENTYCPNCGEELVSRYGFSIESWKISDDMKCPSCGERIMIRGKYWKGRHTRSALFF
ncbi:MAG: AmmeMemoRadiSam system radical SAM enzyme [Promethearchaeati archaeon SRVP18_Atabeyarchaeia-1]